MTEMELSEEEKKALLELDQQMNAGLGEDTSKRIVEILSNPEYAAMYTDLSPNEIKLLVRLEGIAVAFDDDIKKRLVEKYVLFKVSKDRKGRSGMEGFGRATLMNDLVQQGREGIFTKFKRKIMG